MSGQAQGIWQSPAVLHQLVLMQLHQGNEAQLQVVGWSMAPLLHPGDWVRLRRVNLSQVRRGDVVVVWHDNAFLSHRVLRAGADALLLKGDQSLAPDPPLSSRALVGKVVGRGRGGKRLDLDTAAWNKVCALAGWLSAHLAPRSCRLATRLLLVAALLQSDL